MLWGCETHNTGTECFCCRIYIKHVCAHWFTGLAFSCFQTLWLKRLRSKFHNNRKREESALDVVIANQQKFGKSSKKEANEHKGNQKSGSGEMFGMANYLPSAPASEDQESTKLLLMPLLVLCLMDLYYSCHGKVCLSMIKCVKLLIHGCTSIGYSIEVLQWITVVISHH